MDTIPTVCVWAQQTGVVIITTISRQVTKIWQLINRLIGHILTTIPRRITTTT